MMQQLFICYFTALVLSVQAGMSMTRHSTQKISDVCEATCPTCPAKDTSLFDAITGGLLDADIYGEWVVSTSCENKLYLFSDCGLDWFDARDKCCTLGMNLISLPSQDEYDCFAEANTATSGQWWTSATDEGCTYKSKLVFSWCSEPPQLLDDVNSSSDEDLHTWRKKEPNNAKDAEKCVRVETDGGDTYLTDKSCHNMYKYICEGPTTTPAPSCDTSDLICPPRPALDPSVDISTFGDIIPDGNCRVQYMFSNVRKTWLEAYNLCIKAGWHLIAIENPNKFLGFADAYNILTGHPPTDIFWTCATSEGCPAAQSSHYQWCSTFNASPIIYTALWSVSQPDFATPNEKCVDFQMGTLTNINALRDSDCTVAQFFICEKRL